MLEELQDGYRNKINKFLRPDGKVSSFRSFLLSFVMLLSIGAVAYYDYYFPMLTILIVVLFALTLFSARGVFISFFKKK